MCRWWNERAQRQVRIRYGLGVLVAAGWTVAGSAAHAQLKQVETPEVRIVYFDPTETYLLPHVGRTFLNSYRFQRRLFGFNPPDRVTVLLSDFSDSGNASAQVVPRNSVNIEIAPFSYAFETLAANERMNVIMNHELVHVATMGQAANADRRFRRLFGGKVMPVSEHPESMLYFFLTTPRVAAPRWFHEGVAVFFDTWMAGGLGRAQGGYDEMVFRSMVRDGTPLYDPLGLVSEGTKIDFQVEVNSYLYGGRFITWLGRRYSPERVVEWVSRREGSRAYYASQFRQVFGLPLEDAWRAWTADEDAFQRRNLDAIRAFPRTPVEDITKRALGSVSRAYVDRERGRIYAALNYPGVVSHVGAISMTSGEIQKLVDVKGPTIYTVTSLAFDPAGPTLFYTADNTALRDLMSVNPVTRETRLLLKDARIGDLAFNAADRSLWGIRHLNGICSIVRIPPPYDTWQRVHTFPYGLVVYDLDVAPDGSQIVASFGEISGKQSVRVLSTAALTAGDTTPVAQFDFGTAVPNGFTFSPDGRYLFGSSYYTGVSNIFRYDLQAKKVEAVSNTETGLFRPVPIGGDDLIVFRYSGEGFVPARMQARPLDDINPITFLGERLVAEHPVVKDWNVGSPAALPFDDSRREPYRLVSGLRLESMYPIVEGYKDGAAVGYRANFSDPLELNTAYLTATYSVASALPSNERLHLEGGYDRYNWRGMAAWNDADFFDLFGPTKTGRKGYFAEIGHKTSLIFDSPRTLDLDVTAEVAGRLDRLPEFQNVAVDIDRMATVTATLEYANVRKSLGWVDDETGRRWSAEVLADRVAGRTYPRLLATFDQGLALPQSHASLWWRSAAGVANGPRDDVFANFYFGGFGNNWVDRLDEKRYREWYSFPGMPIDDIGGRNFLKSSVEWNLPPWRFRRLGTPAFYASWARPALFVTGLATNLDAGRGVRELAASVGGQLDIRFGVLSTLDLTVSVGAAVAKREGRPAHGEAMLSLKVLR